MCFFATVLRGLKRKNEKPWSGARSCKWDKARSQKNNNKQTKKYDRIDPYKAILLKVLIDWKIITFFFWKILRPEYPRCSFLYY